MTKKGNISIFVPHAGCKNACVFCNQRTIAGRQAPPARAEIIAAAERAASSRTADFASTEIAFFGGSFTAIERPLMESYLETAKQLVRRFSLRGIRLSTRPDSVPGETLELLKRYGVTAIELGAQSLDDAVLKACGRGHAARDVEDACKRIKAAGFELGLQLMTGLPLQSAESALDSLEKALSLEPDTLRIYPCLVLGQTELAELYRRGEYAPQSLPEAVELCAEMVRRSERRGVRVIKVGLHASELYSSQLVAGPYHPAFRELVTAIMLLLEAGEQLKKERLVRPASRTAVIYCNPADFSALRGHGGQALAAFCRERELDRADVRRGGDVERGRIVIKLA